jgi:rhamnosyltransferase
MEINSGSPLVTVVVLTKNSGKLFEEVLGAIKSQITPWQFEILVVDSGSTDGTIEFLASQDGIRLVEIESHEFGHGKTRNLAVREARGEFVAMLTHDAKPADRNWLANLLVPFEKDSAVAGVFGRHLAYESASVYTKRDLKLHFDGFLTWPSIMGNDDPARYERDPGYRQLLHFFSDNNACLRKSVWRQIPYPDVDFAEDQVWAKQIIDAGFKRAYADDAVVYHSHDYAVADTFRRSFDESRALRRLFGYIFCPSLLHGFAQTVACTKRDWFFLFDQRLLINELTLALKTPFLHFAKQMGFFLGSYEGKNEQLLFELFSLDRSKKMAKK